MKPRIFIRATDKYSFLQASIPDSISFAEASYAFHEGDVKVKWEKMDGKVILFVQMPPVASSVLKFAGQEIILQCGCQQFIF